MEEDLAAASSSLENVHVRIKGEAGEFLDAKDGEVDSSKDESWWADSDEEADGVSHLDREWKNRREQFYNAGYRDGVSAGRNDAAQDGFNHGFKDSVVVGYKWGIVRGVTSALAHLPEELKGKLVGKEEVRREFMKLKEAVEDISTEDALKFFHNDMQRVKTEERKNVESSSSASHQSGSESSALENYFGKLDLLLQQSPIVDVRSVTNEDGVPS